MPERELTLAPQELLDSEEQLRLAQEAVQLGHFDWNLETGETVWSESLKRLLVGRLDSQTTLLDRLPLVHPEDRASYRAAVESALAGRTSDISFSYRSLGGTDPVSWRICEARVHLDSAGKPSRIVGIIADITPHKRAEQAQRIELERSRLEAVIQCMTEPVMIFDYTGDCLSMNPAALALHGYLPGDRVPANLRELAERFDTSHLDGSPISPDDWPVNRALAGETITGAQLRVRDRQTGRGWIASNGMAPIVDETGRVVLVVVSVHDITAEHSASEQARQANAALHDFSAQLVKMQDEERKRIARELHDGALQEITAMAMNMLLIARSPAVMSEPETRRLIVDTQQLAKKCSKELRTISYLLYPPDLEQLGLVPALRSWADGFAQRAGIELDIHLEEPGRLDQDAETALFRIAQEALANLHRHSGSEVAQISLTFSETQVCLEIRDQGRGIPPEVLSARPSNIGVGILGMRERARQLKGKLEIESGSKGTAVRASLPRSIRQ